MSNIAVDSTATTTATTTTTTAASAPSNVYRMSGGKGGKGLGKGGAKRHYNNKHKYDIDPLLGLTKGKIRTICQRSGIKRISGTVYEEIRNTVNDYCNDLMGYALCYVKHRNQETLTNLDIVYASKTSKVMEDLYGFDDARCTARGNLSSGQNGKIKIS